MRALFGRRTAAPAAGADEPAAASKPPAANDKAAHARGEQRRRTTSTPGASFFGMGASSISSSSSSSSNNNNKNNVGSTRNGVPSSYYKPQDVSYPTSQGPGGAQEAARSNGKAGPRSSIAGTVGRGLKASRGRLSDTTQTGFSATAAAGVGDAPISQVQPTSKGSGSGSGSATVGGGSIRDGNAHASSHGPSESAKQKVKNRYDSWRRASGAQTSKTSEPSLTPPPAASHDLPAASRLGDAWNGPASSGSRAKLSPAKELPDLPAGTVKKLAASPSGLVSTPGDEAPLYVMNAAGSSKVQRKTAPAAPVAQTQRPGESQTSGARQESSSNTTTIAKGAVATASPRDEGEADQQTTPRPDLPSSGHGELPSILMTPRAGNTTPRVGTATPTFSTMPRPHSSPGLDASDTQRLRSQKLATSSKASTMSRTPNALKNARNKLGSIARSRDSFFSPTSSADAAYNGDVVGKKAGRSKGSQSNQVGVANTAPPLSASAALASELNDLAVAHDEGLLGDEEYRLLRQGAFDRLMKNGAMELPHEGAIRGLGVVSADPDATIPRRRDTEPLASVLEQQQQQQQQKQQQQAYSRERASTLSQTPSVLSLLRRASLLSGKGSEKRASTDQHQHLDPSSSSTASVRQHASNPTLGGRRLTNDSGSLFASNSSRVHSQYSGTSGGHGGTPSSTTRSLSNLRRGGSRRKKERAEELEEAYRTARSTRSLRGAASQILVDPSSSLGVGDDSNASVARMSAMGLSISNGTSLLGVDYADKSSSEIKAERAVVEAEYARLLESFSAMEQMSMGRYSTLDYQQLKKAWALSALNHGGTMPDDIEDPDGNFVLVEGGGESEPAGTQMTKDGKRSSQTGKSNIRKTRSGPLLQPFNSSTGAASGSASSLNGAALLSPPSSYRGPGSPASSSPNNRSRTSLTSLSPPSSPNAPVRGGRAAGSYFSGAVIEAPLDEARSSGNTDEETAQRLILSLKTDLDEIAKRKQDVAAKYSARLDFLKSATRSALIREGLKR